MNEILPGFSDLGAVMKLGLGTKKKPLMLALPRLAEHTGIVSLISGAGVFTNLAKGLGITASCVL